MAEQHDEWADGRRYLGLDVLAKSRLTLITTATDKEANTDVLGAISAQPDHDASRYVVHHATGRDPRRAGRNRRLVNHECSSEAWFGGHQLDIFRVRD